MAKRVKVEWLFQLDQESCIYADKVRSLRQKEYDNASLYSETDAEQAEQLERSRCNFIEYFDHVQRLRHAHSSDSIIINWKRVHELLKICEKRMVSPFAKIFNSSCTRCQLIIMESELWA